MKVELWTADLEKTHLSGQGILSEDEQLRASKFRFASHRDRFIKRRVMLRKLLGAYLGLTPKSVRFGYTELGKPFVTNSEEKLFFNSSHSREYVAIGFSPDGPLGVDVEFLDSEIEAEFISGHFFAAAEISVIQAAQGLDRAHVFFRHWCIKEAFIKYVGKGLTFPLDQVLVRSEYDSPWLEVYEQKDKSPKTIRAVKYLNDLQDFGLAVVGEASELDVKVKEWRG